MALQDHPTQLSDVVKLLWGNYGDYYKDVYKKYKWMFFYLAYIGEFCNQKPHWKIPFFSWCFALNHWDNKKISIIESFDEESTTPKYYKKCSIKKDPRGFHNPIKKILDFWKLMIFLLFWSDRAFATCVATCVAIQKIDMGTKWKVTK